MGSCGGSDDGSSPGGEDHDAERFWQSEEVQWSAASGVLLAAGFLSDLAGASGVVVTALYVLSTVAGVRFFGLEALEELWEEHEIGIELLMTVATLVAGFLGLWGEAATLAFLYSISEALEEFTEDRTRASIRALMDLAPKRVTLLRDGREVEIDLGELSVGDRFVVRPGGSIATDGIVVEGRSAVNEAAVTGESVPVDKEVGDRVIAGTLNTTGALVVEATATASDNTLASIVRLVTEAQARKGRGERVMNRFAEVYSPAVLATGVLTVLAGGAVTGDWSTWAERAATFVVAAAPCALVISIPVSYVAAIGNAGRKGILIKGGVYLEELAVLNALALDKTGTLTEGTPRVVAVVPVRGESEESVLSVAAAVEQRSEHPLARAIVERAHELGLTVDPARDFGALVGAGARAVTSDGREIRVVSPEALHRDGLRAGDLETVAEKLETEGRTAVMVTVDGRPVGLIALADTLRPDAARAVADLHASGIDRVVMLTGDNPRTARRVATEVGVDDVRASLSPADKAAVVAELTAQYGHVGMVGDGINDAPALAAASVGFAMGTAGSDVALETADIALMADDLSKLVEAVRIGRRTRRVVRQNIGLGLVILAVLVPGALSGLLSLPLAVLAHELSELLVITNGMRLARG
ncbi:MAG TPA: cation-translocating P-type ATPase [Acidimicrobiales bacterium]|nr:cation-translocating P-type ATPase [Acidimicrobiales bacterium]